MVNNLPIQYMPYNFKCDNSGHKPHLPEGKIEIFQISNLIIFPFSLYAELFSQRRPIQTSNGNDLPALLKERVFIRIFYCSCNCRSVNHLFRQLFLQYMYYCWLRDDYQYRLLDRMRLYIILGTYIRFFWLVRAKNFVISNMKGRGALDLIEHSCF